MKQKVSIKTATIKLVDCEAEKLSEETTIPSTYAIKHRSTVFLTALTSNITGNNGTHAGNTLLFLFTACNLFYLLFHNSYILHSYYSYSFIKALEQVNFQVLL